MLDKYSQVEFLDRMVFPFVIFEGIFILIAMTAASFCIHTKSVQVFQFTHILTNTCL